MSLSFPSSPSVGQTYTANGRTWQWSGTAWEFYGSAGIVEVASEASLPAAGSTDAIYVASDSGKLYNWIDTTNKYVELGPSTFTTQSIAAANISDSTTAGRALLTAADAAAQRTALSVQPTASPAFTGTVTLSGGQLAFPATANLSADANTLDDYEEGSWTPAWIATTTNPTLVYATQTGRYIKIGKTAWIYGSITVTSVTAAGSGSLRVSGLPFSVSGFNGVCSVGYRLLWASQGPTAGFFANAQSYIGMGALSATTWTATPTTELAANCRVDFSGFYETA